MVDNPQIRKQVYILQRVKPLVTSSFMNIPTKYDNPFEYIDQLIARNMLKFGNSIFQ